MVEASFSLYDYILRAFIRKLTHNFTQQLKHSPFVCVVARYVLGHSLPEIVRPPLFVPVTNSKISNSTPQRSSLNSLGMTSKSCLWCPFGNSRPPLRELSNGHQRYEFTTDIYELNNVIKCPTCYKTMDSISSIDVFLTNKTSSFQNSMAIEVGLADFHWIILTVLKMVL